MVAQEAPRTGYQDRDTSSHDQLREFSWQVLQRETSPHSFDAQAISNMFSRLPFRQRHYKRGPLPFFADGGHGAAVALGDDVVGEGEAEAGALMVLPAAEVRVVQLVLEEPEDVPQDSEPRPSESARGDSEAHSHEEVPKGSPPKVIRIWFRKMLKIVLYNADSARRIYP